MIKPFSVILSEAKNLKFSRRYETLYFVQGDIFRTFARASFVYSFLFIKTDCTNTNEINNVTFSRHSCPVSEYGINSSRNPEALILLDSRLRGNDNTICLCQFT